MQTNSTLQLVLAVFFLTTVGIVLLVVRRSRRRTSIRRIRKEVRSRTGNFRGDARAWIQAQRDMAKQQRTAEEAQLERRSGIAQRLVVKALQTAIPALAAAYAKRMLDRAAAARHPAHEHMPTSEQPASEQVNR